MSLRARLTPLLLVLSLVVAAPVTASAQATVDRTFVEPLEYGVDERHDPFDYAQATDLMTDRDVTVGVDSFVQADETMRFRMRGPRGASWYVSPVWMTFPHHTDANVPASKLPDADGGALHDQRDGLALPVDAERYTDVSIRFHVSGDPGLMYLSWFTCQEWLPQCQGMMDLSRVAPLGELRQGWNTISVRIENNVRNGLVQPWSGTVHGLRFQGVAEAEATVTLDWFRLHEHAEEHVVTVPVRDRYLYSDTPTPSFAGARTTDETWGWLGLRDYSRGELDLGGLPPGTWYLFDDRQRPVGQVTVRPRPRPEILDPDMAGGPDYATEVLDNPWDFEDRADFVSVGNSANVRLSGGELSAQAVPTPAAPRGNDPLVLLPLHAQGLDPVHYHRVTVDQHYDAPFNLDDGGGANNPRPGGSHGRLIWRTDQHASPSPCRPQSFSDGREFVFYKTWDAYTYDMKHVPAAQGMTSSAEPNIGLPARDACGGQRTFPPDPHWTGNGPITYLRFDPHEAPDDYRWYLRDLRIAADDAADPTFDITWVDHDRVPGTQVTVRLDTDRSGYDGEVVARVTQDQRRETVTIDATDRLPATSWVNITSTTPDGRVSRDYATGPLQVSPRISGRDRIATAVEASSQSFDRARTAVVASAEAFPDALAAVQLADAVGGPVLLTPPGQADRRVIDELERLGAREAVVVGGEAAVGPRVATQLRTSGVQVTRIGGADRYETSVAIARAALGRRGASTAPRVLVTTGENFPDALAAGPLVGHSDTPLILAAPSPEHNDGARRFLDRVNASRATFIGGPNAVSPAVANHLAAGRSTDRIAGSDRFETARRLTAAAVDAGAGRRDVLIATGRNFPDALAAGPAALARGGVLVLTEPSFVPPPTRDWLRSVGSWSSWRVVGGPVAVSHATVRDLRRASDLSPAGG